MRSIYLVKNSNDQTEDKFMSSVNNSEMNVDTNEWMTKLNRIDKALDVMLHRLSIIY